MSTSDWLTGLSCTKEPTGNYYKLEISVKNKRKSKTLILFLAFLSMINIHFIICLLTTPAHGKSNSVKRKNYPVGRNPEQIWTCKTINPKICLLGWKWTKTAWHHQLQTIPHLDSTLGCVTGTSELVECSVSLNACQLPPNFSRAHHFMVIFHYENRPRNTKWRLAHLMTFIQTAWLFSILALPHCPLKKTNKLEARSISL